jgi:hypothetical protein
VADNGRVRIEVGFTGGGALAALTSQHLVDDLEQALAQNHEGAFAIDAEDGRYTLVLRQIVYLKRFSRESRVGFGAL